MFVFGLVVGLFIGAGIGLVVCAINELKQE